MCGVGGIIVRHGAPDRDALVRLRDALRHRGPDGHGISVDGNVGLVHTRLAIVDPSTGAQPIMDGTGRLVMSFNGEIYNHAELRAARLGATVFRGSSDTETLVELLARSGLGVLPDLRGIFALAAHDRSRREVVLTRDAFGVKPLYVIRGEDTIWFASEIRALIAAGAPVQLHTDALRHFLQERWVNDATLLDGVQLLEPGTTMSIDATTLDATVSSWYDPTDSVDAELSRSLEGADRDHTSRLVEERLRQAVRRQLMSDVPVATMCSGGVDSSLLTALARDEVGTVCAYNVSIRDQPDRDEHVWAARVAEHLGADLRTIVVDQRTWLDGFVGAVEHYEYPLGYEASVALAALAEAASSDGVKVLLSGEGADEILGGYPWLHRGPSADFAARNSVVRRARRSAATVRDRVRHPASGPGASRDADRHDAAVRDRCLEAYGHHRGARRRLEGALLSDFQITFPQILMRGDKNTMQHSVESRVPFLDRDLVDLCVNLPLEHRIEPARKNPLVTLAERLLPPGLATRPKVGFDFDVSDYLRSEGKRAFIEDGMVAELLQSDAGSTVGLDPYRADLLVWSAEVWARLFLDGQSRASVEKELFGG